VRFSCANHLFYKKHQTSDEFKFISGTKGQVWSLFEQETLCGHDSGTFVMKTPLQKYIFGFRNVKFETVPNQRVTTSRELLWTFSAFENK
jgi:hypothetical protein